MKIAFIIGARPNFVKAAPVINAFRKNTDYECVVIHTGQHFDENMSDIFLRQLEIGKPDINLCVGSGSHSIQTAKVMMEAERVFIQIRPDWVFVFGDVNSTIAAALVAKKLQIRVTHIESGLRSFDMTMPEEINRILTDRISDLLFVTEQSGVDNLIIEGVSKEKILFVGNTMIDCLMEMESEINKNSILKILDLEEKDYILVTLHRPSNVDDVQRLNYLIKKITEWSGGKKILFPVHPRVKQDVLTIDRGKWQLIKPIGYIEFLKLMKHSFCVYTDSGGIQEETSFLGVRCYTLRENTERPVTCSLGTNTLLTAEVINGNNWAKPENSTVSKSTSIPLWDGKSASRIVEHFIFTN